MSGSGNCCRMRPGRLPGGEPGDTNRIPRILIRKLRKLRIPRILQKIKNDLDIGKRVKYWNIWTMPRGDTNRIIRTLGILRILRKLRILGKLRILQTNQKDHDIAMRVKYQVLPGGEPGDTNRILKILGNTQNTWETQNTKKTWNTQTSIIRILIYLQLF